MSFKLSLLFMIFLLFLIKTEGARRRFNLKFYNFTCQIFGKRIKQVDCSFLKLSNEHYTFKQSLTFERDMDSDLKFRLWIDVKQQLLQKYVRFIDVKLDACSALTHTFDPPFLNTIVSEYKRSTNLPSQCPFKGNYQYKMENFSVTTDKFPAYAPECNFTFGYDLYDINTLFASYKIIGGLVNK